MYVLYCPFVAFLFWVFVKRLWVPRKALYKTYVLLLLLLLLSVCLYHLVHKGIAVKRKMGQRPTMSIKNVGSRFLKGLEPAMK